MTSEVTRSGPPEVLLEVNDLRTRFFTAEGTVNAVNGVSFSLDRGECLGLVGESGCGKSATALSLMGLLPSAGRVVDGEVWFDGRDLLRLSEENLRRIRGAEIGMIFQDPMTSLNPLLPISVQIGEAIQLHWGFDAQAARTRTIELLDLVGIPAARARVDDYPHQFSGGMRQRVMIAMALSCEPNLLVADEPTTALDVSVQAQILELIVQLGRDLGMAIILISHDMGVVAGIADRVGVMYAGYIVETGHVFEIFEDPKHPYTLGLLRSIPRIDRPRERKLSPIRGVPPDLVQPSPGCPFAPRCPSAFERCIAENPRLEEAAPGHFKACWATEILQSASSMSTNGSAT